MSQKDARSEEDLKMDTEETKQVLIEEEHSNWTIYATSLFLLCSATGIQSWKTGFNYGNFAFILLYIAHAALHFSEPAPLTQDDKLRKCLKTAFKLLFLGVAGLTLGLLLMARAFHSLDTDANTLLLKIVTIIIPQSESASALLEKVLLFAVACLYARQEHSQSGKAQQLRDLNSSQKNEDPTHSHHELLSFVLGLICSTGSIEVTLIPYALACLLIVVGFRSKLITMPLTVILVLDIIGNYLYQASHPLETPSLIVRTIGMGLLNASFGKTAFINYLLKCFLFGLLVHKKITVKVSIAIPPSDAACFLAMTYIFMQPSVLVAGFLPFLIYVSYQRNGIIQQKLFRAFLVTAVCTLLAEQLTQTVFAFLYATEHSIPINLSTALRVMGTSTERLASELEAYKLNPSYLLLVGCSYFINRPSETENAEWGKALAKRYLQIQLFTLLIVTTVGQPTVLKLILFTLFLGLCITQSQFFVRCTAITCILSVISIYAVEILKVWTQETLPQVTGITSGNFLPYLVLMFIFNCEVESQELQEDLLTGFIKDYQVELLSVALLFECAFPPISALNMILLLVFVLMAWKQFRGRDISSTIFWLKWISAFLLMTKFLFQFIQYYIVNGDYSSITNDSIQASYQTIVENIPVLQKVFGLENANSLAYQVKMLTLALICSLCTMKRLQEQREPSELNQAVSQWLSLLIIPVPCLLIIAYAILNNSMMGLISLGVGIHQCLFNMKRSYEVIGPFAALAVLAHYVCQYTQTQWIFGYQNSMVPLIAILIACQIQLLTKSDEIVKGNASFYLSRYGHLALLMLLAFSSLQKRNIISLVLLWLIWRLMWRRTNTFYASASFVIAIVVSLELSSTLIDTQYSVKLFLYVCQSEECLKDYSAWFSLANVTVIQILLDCVTLFTAVALSSHINDISKPQVPLNVYIYLNHIVLLCTTIYAATIELSLETIFYSAVVMKAYIRIDKFYSQTPQTSWIENLRYLNFIFLTLKVVFQAPLFPCPVSGSTQYLAMEECIRQQQGSVSDPDLERHLYLNITASVGLTKSISISSFFVFLFAITELLHFLTKDENFMQLFNEIYSQENLIDRKMKAFLFVEQQHLNTLWAYKAIKEEIRILHQRLLRITQQIKSSDHSKHLVTDFEDDEEYDENKNLLEQERPSQTSEESEISTLLRASVSQNDESLPMRMMLDQQYESLLLRHSNDIENLALDLLLRSGKGVPVVPLKLFMAAFKNFLRSESHNQLRHRQTSAEEPFKLEIDHRQIEEYLLQIACKLQKQVLLKSKIGLYHQTRIGLHFTLDKGSDSLLKDQPLKNFFRHLFNVNQRESELREIASDPLEEVEVEDSFHHPDELLTISVKKPENRQVSWLTSLGWSLKLSLWNRVIDHSLYYSIVFNYDVVVSLYSLPFYQLFFSAALSQSVKLTVALIIVNFIINADLISFVMPLCTFTYQLMSSPIPSPRYWMLLLFYSFAVVITKSIYQLPMFCGTPNYSLNLSASSCSSQLISTENLLKRLDYIIGVHKYSGTASYPRDIGLFIGILPDLLVFGSLLVVRSYLQLSGKWDYVKISKSIYDTPCFYQHEEEPYEQPLSRISKLQAIPGKVKKEIIFYLKRVLPVFMKLQIKNRDSRKQYEEPLVPHNVKRVKPGRDFFAMTFTTLVLIFIFNLFFFRQLTVATTNLSASSSPLQLQLQRFSIPQVAILFFLLLLMMIERMLYRARYVDSMTRDGGSRIGEAKSGVLGKHQLTFKLALHVFLVILVHIELGIVVPRHFSNNNGNIISLSTSIPLMLYYLLFVAYFVFSSLQIKYGYPQAAFKAPFLPGENNQFTIWAFRLYKAIPFLWEMRVVVDWTVTAATCLDLSQWFKLDDAFNGLFQCQLQHWERSQYTNFKQRSCMEKLCQGFCFAFGLILIILAPILLFSGINPIMVSNPVLYSSMTISMSVPAGSGLGYRLLSTQAFDIQDTNSTALSQIFNIPDIAADLEAQDLDARNIQVLQFSQYSESSWQISPPSLERLLADVNYFMTLPTAHYFQVGVRYAFKRAAPIGNEIASYQSQVNLPIEQLRPVLSMLSSNESSESSIIVQGLLPQFLRLGETQQAHTLDDIFSMPEVNQSTSNQSKGSINLSLKQKNGQLYWTYEPLDPMQESLYAYNEQVIGSLFGTALQLSVVGLYATIVIAIGRFLRLAFDRISQRVIYEEMDPDTTDQLFEICEGIYIAQLEGDLVKERKLYDLLIRMYRSPETLIKIKRNKEHMHLSIREEVYGSQ